MSSSANASVSNDKHRQREPPEPRALACKACRKKKHLCDRGKPFCTPCVNVGQTCVYANRKARPTVSELEDVLRKLEKKYATHSRAEKKSLKARRGPAKATLKPNATYTSTFQNAIDAILLVDSIPSHSADSDTDSTVRFQSSRSTSGQIHDTPGGGYRFDESFLKMPSFNSEHSSGYQDIPHQLDHPRGSPQYPTHIFTPIIRSPSTSSTSQTNFKAQGWVSSKAKSPEDDMTEIQTATLTPISPLNYLSQSLESSSDEWQPHTQTPCTFSPYTHQSEETPQDSDWRSTSPHREHKRPQTCQEPEIIHAPSLHFSRATWWDCLLNTYSIFPCTIESGIPRRSATLVISQDVYTFFQAAPLWLSCMNVPRFFDTFYHTGLRTSIQPALVLSILAYSKFIQSNRDVASSEHVVVGEREQAWKQSVILRELAQASFEASYNAGWIDLPLAQAAWILALYEMSPHRHCSSHRSQSSIMLLDNVIRALRLTSIDIMDPRAPTFAANTLPALGRPLPNGVRYAYQACELDFEDAPAAFPGPHLPIDPSPTGGSTYYATAPPPVFKGWKSSLGMPDLNHYHAAGASRGCPCQALSLAMSPEVLKSTPTWGTMPRWTADASWAEIRKEEARRLVWSSVIMFATDANARQVCGTPLLDLFISKAENFALLYPGEDNYTSLPGIDTRYSGKESNWALWGRTLLLWFSCVRRASRRRLRAALPGRGLLSPPSLTGDELAEHDDAYFGMQAWMETVAIEEALDAHSCKTEQSMMYQAREFIFTIRMQVSGGFRRFIPVAQTGVNFSQLNRDSVTEWGVYSGPDKLCGYLLDNKVLPIELVNQQDKILTVLLAATAKDQDYPGRKILVRRPFVVYICLALLWRALQLLRVDRSISHAVEVALKCRRIIEWYQQIWPSAELQRWAEKALRELEYICNMTGEHAV